MTESTAREPRPDKVAVVEEIIDKMRSSQAIFVTEYRGLNVGELAKLRNDLRPAETELKVYKNTMIRRAAEATGNQGLLEMLVGPTALALVSGDIAGAAKTLVEMSKVNPLLVVKGGLLGQVALDASAVKTLATLPSREQLLAQVAGALQAPMVKTAGLLQALPRNFAYGLSALIAQRDAA
jgi:large subunit ribosomal protein L10